MVKKHIGILLLLLLLVAHLSIINDYGFTWDFHFHFFGGGKLLGYEWWQLEPRDLPFVEPDPRNAWSLPYGPLMSIPPVASYLLFHKTLSWLAADNAYHLPIVLWGVAGIGILYAFLAEAFPIPGIRRIPGINPLALLAAIFLALTPRYFGDLHNNMKDVPNATVFALNMWFLWRLVRYRRLKDLLLAAAAFAVAFNVKVNSIFIPVIFAAWILIIALLKTMRVGRYLKGAAPYWLATSARVPLSYWYFLAAPLAALLLWWFFWPDPIGQLKHAWLTFGVGTNNIEVILNGNWYCSGQNVPWYYPYWYLAITTPLPILGLFVIGLLSSFFTVFLPNFKFEILNLKFIGAGSPDNFEPCAEGASRSEDRRTREIGRATSAPTKLLLLLWFFLPLTRYLIPKIGVIDGIRHFEEVLYPLAALSALGAIQVFKFFNNITIKQYNNRWRTNILIGAALGIFIHLLWNVISYHPYQITYFNELVGGVKGAFGKYDLDYWGTSQKQAVAWVNQHAPEGAKVHLVMAGAVAGGYLRPDLLTNLNKYSYDDSDFVVLLNRQSFFYRFFYAYEYLLRHQPTHTIAVRGVPLVWIYDNRTENKTPRQTPWWQGEDPCIIKYWRGERL